MPIMRQEQSLSTQFLNKLPIPAMAGDGLGANELTMYREVLLSSRILEPVAQKCSLAHKEAIRDAVSKLKKFLGVTITKGQLIKVHLEYPASAEAVVCAVNELVPQLTDYLEKKGLTRAQAKRLFLGQQILEKRTELADIQKQMLSFSEESKTITLDANFRAQLEKSSSLFLQRSKLQIQETFLKTFFPESQTQLKSVLDDLAKIDTQIQSFDFDTDRRFETSTSFQKMPMLSLIFAQLKQQQAVAKEMLIVLTQQYETARLDEIEQKSRFEILEEASIASSPSSPRLFFNLIVFNILILAFLLGLALFKKPREFS